MASRVVRGRGRARQDELAGEPAIVYRAAHVVPERRLHLPLVEQQGRGRVEQKRGVNCEDDRYARVGVHPDLARGYLQCRDGLPA